MKRQNLKIESKEAKTTLGVNVYYPKGITLISLVITIILLIILAGIVINIAVGENGIIKIAKQTRENYNKASIKEELELELLNIQTKKYEETGKKASLEEVKELINKNKYEVNIEEGSSWAQIEDIEKGYSIIVDENLTIQDIEKTTNKDKSIKIETKAINKEDYTTATITIKITVEEKITSIKIGEEEIQIPEKVEENGKNIYEIEKEVEKNANYKIRVETVSGKINTKIQNVSNLSEDMEIYTAQDLVKFRERVEKGATYEKRTVTLMNDIDLSAVCGKEISWKPIGYKTLDPENEDDDYIYFRGTFNGQYKNINNLYIKTDEYEYAGLFFYNAGTIKNIKMNNVNIYADYSNSPNASDWHTYIGSLVGYNVGTIENVGINSGSITNINTCQPTRRFRVTAGAGIAGYSLGDIKSCYNCANIEIINVANNNQDMRPANHVGGIVATSFELIENCYNVGNVIATGGWYTNDTGGITGRMAEGEVTNCYNYGTITAQNANTNLAGGIVGRKNSGSITKTYYTDTSTAYSYWSSPSSHYTTGKVTEENLKGYATKLNEGNEIEIWTDDTGINNGYPILKWQIEQ